jgi:hypothetical protein
MAGTKKDQKHAEMLRKQWTLHEDRLKRERLSCDVISCASNEKWYRIFDSLRSQLAAPRFIRDGSSRVKLLREDEPFEYPRLLSSCFEDEYLEGFHGILGYREIEWIEIQVGGAGVEFDCQIECEVVADALRIYGYRRSQGPREA